MHFKKLVLAAITTIMLLSVAATAASALRSLEYNEARVTLLSSEITFTSGGARVICAVGITVNLATRAFAKREARIGTAEIKVLGQETGAERCSESRGRVLTERGPFPVFYLSFTGTLPNITGLNLKLERIAFLATVAGISCLYIMNILGFQRLTAGLLEELRGEARGNRFTVESQTGGGGLCPEPRGTSLEGIFRSQRAVRITLI